MISKLGHEVVKQVVRDVQQRVRSGTVTASDAVEFVLAALPAGASSMRPVLNATGVILHTNLGRAPLSAAAIDAVADAAGYVDVEYDPQTGGRTRRGRAALEGLLRRVPEADAALVVNNGAAALVLAATALASGREIIVSRGEMVEIGDGFRLPELLTSTGAVLREVGTTNRTKLDDYASAVGPDTGFVLKVHPSNFVVSGFTAAVSVAELAGLGVPVVADIGSGLLEPDPLLPDEPDAATWLRDGATLVTASGDKLLGGPQAGILVGTKEAIAACRRHPLARALRIGRLPLAALAATLAIYRDPARAVKEIPVLAMLAADQETLMSRAQRLADATGGEVIEAVARAGGGALPLLELKGPAVAIAPHPGGPDALAARLRAHDPPLVARITDGRVVVDPRTLQDDELDQAAAAINAA
jgi:L-seryl-tRNA(Ser) seleniumtransferase